MGAALVPAPCPEKQQAKADGSYTYFTGKPCVNGHVAPRYTQSGACSACLSSLGKGKRERVAAEKAASLPPNFKTVVDLRREAMVRGDKVFRVGEQCSAGHTSGFRVDSGDCVQCSRDRARRWRRDNPARFRDSLADYCSRNADRQRAKTREWAKSNPERVRDHRATTKKHVKHATICGSTYSRQIASIYRQARELTKITGTQYVVDHVVPLRGKKVCGLHVPWNLQVITSDENLRKLNKFNIN